MKAQSLFDEPEEGVCLSHNKGDGHMIPRPDLHAHAPRDAGTYVCCQRNPMRRRQKKDRGEVRQEAVVVMVVTASVR